MKKFSYKITDTVGIHARPAGLLVKQAQAFSSSIIIKNTENLKSGDAKKIFSIMGLAVKCGTVVDVTAEGSDESDAIAKLETFFKENL